MMMHDIYFTIDIMLRHNAADTLNASRLALEDYRRRDSQIHCRWDAAD